MRLIGEEIGEYCNRIFEWALMGRTLGRLPLCLCLPRSMHFFPPTPFPNLPLPPSFPISHLHVAAGCDLVIFAFWHCSLGSRGPGNRSLALPVGWQRDVNNVTNVWQGRSEGEWVFKVPAEELMALPWPKWVLAGLGSEELKYYICFRTHIPKHTCCTCTDLNTE